MNTTLTRFASMAFLVTLGSLSMAACAVSPAASGDESAANVASDANGKVDPAGYHGGGGGRPPVALTCPTLLGLAGATGDYVDRLQILCGDVGGSPWDGPTAGSGNSNNQFWQACPPGFVVNGFQGRAGKYLDAVGVLCVRPDNPTQKWAGPISGGGGGGGFYDTCPAGQKVTTLWVRGGSWIDGIDFNCSAF